MKEVCIQLQYIKDHDTEIAYGLLMQNVKRLINKWEFIGNITRVLFYMWMLCRFYSLNVVK